MNKIGQVLSCAPNVISVEIDNLKIFEDNKSNLQVGGYLQIASGNNDYILAVIKNIKGGNSLDEAKKIQWNFLIECQALGTMIRNDDHYDFERGGTGLPVPTEPVYTVEDSVLTDLFSSSEGFTFQIGNISLNKNIPFKINGDKFFGKHIAIVGSTGSGKSCAVAKVLQDIVGITNGTNLNIGNKNNSHVIIFDIHSEYKSAFLLKEAQDFTLNVLDFDTLKLPYWLMNSEELESIFIESKEENSHNQISQFKQAVIWNKEKFNPTVHEITYDSPVYFSISEVRNYIENMNREVIGRLEGENLPKLSDGSLITSKNPEYFSKIFEFATQSTAKLDKATNGAFNGQFNRFLSRLETKLSDKRLRFLLNPAKSDGNPYLTMDFESIMKQFLGYLSKSNVTIVDLSGVPFEVLSVTVSLVSRLVFDFCFHYSKLRHETGQLNDIPVMVVCEEAHNYVPQNEAVEYRASRKSIERIAKEGRKYGLSLMVVSQRPSEVSETIFAQCNNFIALRLTNVNDQSYIQHLIPDNASSLTDILPILGDGECIIVGDSVLIPMTVQLNKPDPEPQSQSVQVYKEWQKNWKDVTFSDVISHWRKE